MIASSAVSSDHTSVHLGSVSHVQDTKGRRSIFSVFCYRRCHIRFVVHDPVHCIFVAGILFLTSHVIATFEATYDRKKLELSKSDKQKKMAALAYPFVLSTWLSSHDSRMLQAPFANLIVNYWQAGSSSKTDLKSDYLDVDEDSLLAKLEKKKLSNIADNLTRSISNHFTDKKSDLDKVDKSKLQKDVVRMLAHTIFQAVDIDDNGSVEFDEFVEVFAIASCMAKIRKHPLVAYRVICARWELELQDAKESRDDKRHKQVSKLYMRAKQNMSHQIHQHERDRALNGIRWVKIDDVLIAILIGHTAILALYGTSLSTTAIYTVSSVLTCFYSFEMGTRVYYHGGFKKFSSSTLHAHSSWANRGQLLIVAVCLFAFLLYLCLPAYASCICQAIMSLNLFRVLLLSKSFVKVLHSFCHGLQPIVVYVQLFGVSFYMFSYIAWQIFDGKLEAEEANFNSLGDSMVSSL